MDNQPTHTYLIGPPPTVVDHHPTTAWLVREIKQMAQAVEGHQPPRGVAIQRARTIAADVDGLVHVHGGRKMVKAEDIPAIERAHDELAALLVGLPRQPTSQPAMAHQPADRAPLPAVRPAAAIVPHEQAQEVLQQVRAERAQLPTTRPRWPFSPSRRRVRAWTRVWAHTFNYPIDEARLRRAWQAYTARWNPPPPPEKEPHHA